MRSLGVAIALLTVFIVGVAPSSARPTPEQKCAVAKNVAAAKKIAAKLKCWQKALARGVDGADTDCLAATEAKFDKAIARAEAKGGCVVVGDATKIEGSVDKCVSNIVGLTPTIACQVATLSCQCGSLRYTATQQCNSPAPLTCSQLHDNAASNCSLNGQPSDGCDSTQCTDACTGATCG